MAKQDSRGFMWFATDQGVCRFDGYQFKNYTTNNGLADNTIFGVYEDYKNRIWFYSFSGQLSYYYNEHIYTHSANQKLRSMAGSEIINSMYVDEGDTIWLGFANTALRLKITPDQNVIKLPDEWKKRSELFIQKYDNKVNSFGINRESGSEHRGILMVKEGQSITSIQLPVSLSRKSSHNLYSIPLRNGGLLMGIGKNLIQIYDKEVIGHYKTNTNTTHSLFEDSKGNFWVGMVNNGAFCFSNGLKDTNRITNYLPNQSVSHVFEDNEGGLWFTTLTNGVFFLPSREFLSFSQQLSLQEDALTSIAGNKSGIWAGSANGNIYHLTPEKTKGYRVSSKKFGTKIFNMTRLSDGSIWAESDSNLLTISSEGEISIHPIQGNISISESFDGGHWLGFRKGLKKWREGNIVYQSQVDNFKKRTISVLEESPGKVWLGCLDGLWFFNGQEFEQIGKTNPIFNNRVNSMAIDQDGNLWLATLGAGVIIKKGNRFQTIDRDDGLAGNLCSHLYIDSLNNIWVGTNQGLSKIEGFDFDESEAKYSIRNYTTIEGLIFNEIKQVFVAEKKVWVATPKGITLFDQQKVKMNNTPPPIYIQNIRIREKDTLIKEQYDLAYNKNFITIDFVGISFNNAGQLLYRYKMDGLDDEPGEWRITKDQSVNYTTLPPGFYQFTVYAMNNSGKWSDLPAKVSFTISPPFYRTWWFIFIAIGAVISIIWFVFYFRYRTLKMQTNLLRRTLISEQKALRSQMTPHFIFNALNSIQQLISANDRLQAIQSTSKFAKLMRKILNNSKESAITLSEEIETLQLYLDLESLRFEGKFEYIIKIGMDIDTEDTEIPPMLIQPYLENALWHGIMNRPDRSGKLELKIDRRDQLLVCSVTDNGIGRKKALALKSKHSPFHKSSGMNITEERLKILNATRNSSLSVKVVDLEDKYGEPLGTRVEIYVPLDY